jgi:predicted DNA-binding transcriptional regulator YafY
LWQIRGVIRTPGDDLMRADRLLSILSSPRVNRRMTAASLVQRPEVSPRTIHLDMEALSMAGVPVYAERGAGGGWLLSDTCRSDVTGLTEPETQVLFGSPMEVVAPAELRELVAGVAASSIALPTRLDQASCRSGFGERQRQLDRP